MNLICLVVILFEPAHSLLRVTYFELNLGHVTETSSEL
jgi:hypothetical protein